MEMFSNKDIFYHISIHREFKYVKQVGVCYKMDLGQLCNFALDSYNYHRRCGLDVRGAKFLALSNVTDYALQLQESKNG